jgi:hypothetical protein
MASTVRIATEVFADLVAGASVPEAAAADRWVLSSYLDPVVANLSQLKTADGLDCIQA